MIKAILTDIEGTTSSISFVKDVLFPYAADAMHTFLVEHQSADNVASILESLWQEFPELDGNIEKTAEQLKAWIVEDKKETHLKALQGLIWVKGYETGVYQAHVYADAHQYLTRWSKNLPIYIYSSGSVGAQKLFFKYSCFGDLLGLFSGHFDTQVGGKKESSSYKTIVESLGKDFEPKEILFLSDVLAELDAARSVGLATAWLRRPDDCQDAVPEGCPHPDFATFDQVSEYYCI